MSEILLQIDGKEVKATEGMTVLEAAQQADIFIQTLMEFFSEPGRGHEIPGEEAVRAYHDWLHKAIAHP